MGNYIAKILKGEQPYDVNEFYNAETKIITMHELDIALDPKGLGFILFESLKQHFGKIAQRDAFTDEAETYDDLYTKSLRTAVKLQKVGIKPGDRVTICSHNQIDCASAYLGTIFIGAIPANVDPAMSQDDIEGLVSQVSPKLFFVSEESELMVQSAIQNLKLDAKIVVFGDTKDSLKYQDFICEQGGEDAFEPFVPESLDETMLILFSSGSTGLPKGICLSYKFMCYHTQLGSIQSYMIYPTLYWISANLTMITVLRSGGTRSMIRVFDPEMIWSHVIKYEVSSLQASPFEALEYIKVIPKTNEILPLGQLSLGGFATTKENIEKIRKALPQTCVGDIFAMTETGILFFGIDPVSYMKLNSVGIPLPNIQYKIVDPETEETLSFDQPGELRVKSNFLFSGYYNKDSSDNFDKDDFFKTGDIAYFDKDFSFFIVDRIKEMFKHKGIHIIPVKLEKILINHPEVKCAVIIGVPHPTEEHRVSAVIVPEQGSKVTPEEVEEFFNARVDDRQKIRAGVKFLDAIPLTPTGKINRIAVRKMVIGEVKK